MNNVKKIFVVVSAIIVAVMVALVVTLKNVKSNVHINYASPYKVNIFDHSTVAIDSNKFLDEDGGYDNILSKINEITNISAFEKLINRVNLDEKIIQDSEASYTVWSTDIKNKNIVIEFTYDKEQDLVVYKNGKTRVISYWSLALVIPSDGGFTEIIAYYANTNESTGTVKDKSYASCEPLVMHGNFTEFYNYLKSI